MNKKQNEIGKNQSSGAEKVENIAALAEERWENWTQDDFNARVSPPPYDR